MISSSKLSTLGNFKNGLNFAKHIVNVPMKFIGIPDFGEEIVPNYDTLSTVDESVVPSEYYLQNGDILFVRSNGNRNLVGRTMIIENIQEKIGYSGFCIRFRTTDLNVNQYYLLYYLKSPMIRGQLSLTRQSNINNINQDTLGNLIIRFPTYSEQTSIVSAISNIDRKIAINNDINAELENMARTLYDYWFTQFDFPDLNGKPYKSSDGAMVLSKELKRDIPKGWKVERIESLLINTQRTERILTSDYHSDGEIPIIDQSKEYIAGYTDNVETVIKNENGAVVFGDHTRIVKYVNFDFARGADGTQIVQTNMDIVPTIYLYYVIKTYDLSNYGYSRHFKFLKEQYVLIPKDNIAVLFAKKIKQWHYMMTNNRMQNKELAKLRDLLLPLLMNGQLTIK
jgi:type I restriction enzyme S subunit